MPILPGPVRSTHMMQTPQTRCFKEALARVRFLFMEIPGAKLTTADAAQMAGLDREVCRVLLRNLIETGFLEQCLGGVFVRRASASHSAKQRIEMVRKI